VKLFSFSLNRSLAGGLFPPGVIQYVRSNATKLAGLELPSNLDSAAAAIIHNSISQAFVFGFRTLMLACAGLSLASAGVAGLMIPSEKR
jgi:predicted phage tail protein